MRQGYVGTTMNLQIEDTCQTVPTPPPPKKNKNKNPKLKISNPQKSFDHPCPLKFGVPRWEVKQGCDLHVPAPMAPHSICLVEMSMLSRTD